MKRATVIGPLRPRSRRRSTRAKVARGSRAGPAVAPDDQREADRDHRQRQQLAHGQPAEQEAELDVGLAEQLGDDARDAVADQEGAGQAAFRAGRARPERADRASPGTAARPPGRPRRAGSDGGARRRRPGTPWPRARRSAAPQSSPLMKLASRPRNRPIGVAQAIVSPTSRSAQPALAGEQRARGHDPEHAAMERHAALPDGEDRRAGG